MIINTLLCFVLGHVRCPWGTRLRMPFPGGFAHHSSVAPSSATAEGSHWGLRPGAPAGLEPLYVSIVDHGVDGHDALRVVRSPYPARRKGTQIRPMVKLQFERPICVCVTSLSRSSPPPPSLGGAMCPCTSMLTSRTCSLLRHPRHRRSQPAVALRSAVHQPGIGRCAAA
jgi:hypothetical protein